MTMYNRELYPELFVPPRCQFNYGDRVLFRLMGTGDVIPGYVTAVDIPTRRLRICYGDDGTQCWVYMEWAWRV